MRTRIVVALTGLGLAALVVWALRPQPIVVEVAAVGRGAFEQTIVEDGKTRVRDRYVVSAPLAGHVARISLRSGDVVDEGQVVAVVTPSLPAFLDARTERELAERSGAAEAQRLRAHAEVLKARAQLAQASADRDRAARLAREGFTSPAALEQAQLAWRTVQSAEEAATFAEHAAEHDEAQARAALARYRAEGPRAASRGARWEVRSPVRGSVLKVVQESEGIVALGAPLVEIADPRGLEIAVDVLSQEATGVVPGMPARIGLGPAVDALAARVRHVEPAAFTKVSALGIEEQRVNVILDFVEPLERVRTVGDAFRVEAQIVTFRTDEAVTAPVGALFRSGSQWSAFVVEGGRAVQKAVIVSRRNASDALVDAGLAVGDKVVMYPSEALRDGARVSVLDRPGR